MRIEFTADTATFDDINEALVSGLAIGEGSRKVSRVPEIAGLGSR